MATDRVGLVVAGAGARGAYEAGALTVLVPRLATAGSAPTILIGTSAGALNVVGLAGYSSQGWETATAKLVELWSSISLPQIVNLLPSVVTDLSRYGAQILGLPASLQSLLDTAPMRETLSRLLPLEQLHEAIRTGPIDAVGVATTSTTSGGTVVFIEKKASVPLPDFDPTRNITYVKTELTVDHVMASAAVPIAFRPVEITLPPSAAGWYVDGGVRLNAPLKPALSLGCRRLGVVATHPTSWLPTPEAGPAGAPDVFRSAALALTSLMADRMVEDLGTLAKVNRLLPTAGRQRYRKINFMFAGPAVSESHALADLANSVYRSSYSGLRGIRHPTVKLFERLLGGAPDSHGELLSFFFFEPAFTGPAALLGAEHARTALSVAASVTGDAWREVI